MLFALACDGPAPATDASVHDAASIDAAMPIDATMPIDSTTDAAAPVEGVVHRYEEDPAPVGGPERGFYRFAELTETSDLSWVADGGHVLVFSYVRLDDFRGGPIGDALLGRLERGLDEVRARGLKTVLRFAYNAGPYPDSEPDAPRDRVLAHIAQLAPLLERHRDVILLVQAGFIGAWGEWHTSTNGLLDDPADRRAILEALLDALPGEMPTQLRYPLHKEEMFGGALTAAGAHDGSDAARVGHHNDCFLSSDTDVGTYPPDSVDRLTAYVAADTRFVPMGGETCAPYPSRSRCAPALAELERLHFSFLNEDYHPDIVQGWRDEGCYDAIAEGMGYRLVVTSATFPDEAPAGATIAVEVTIRNDGWAAPITARPLLLSLGGERAALDRDARWLLPGEETTLRATLPASEGALSLSAPDPSPRLADRAEYALPFANVEREGPVMRLGEVRLR